MFLGPGDTGSEPDSPGRGLTHQARSAFPSAQVQRLHSNALPQTGPGPRNLPAVGHCPLLSVVSMSPWSPPFTPDSSLSWHLNPQTLTPLWIPRSHPPLLAHLSPNTNPSKTKLVLVSGFCLVMAPGLYTYSFLCLDHSSSHVNEELCSHTKIHPLCSFCEALPPPPPPLTTTCSCIGPDIKNIPIPGMNDCLGE